MINGQGSISLSSLCPLCVCGSNLSRRVRELFELRKLIAVADRDQRVAGFEHRFRGGVEHHLPGLLLDRDDDDLEIGTQPAVLQSAAGERAAGAEARLFELQV